MIRYATIHAWNGKKNTFNIQATDYAGHTSILSAGRKYVNFKWIKEYYFLPTHSHYSDQNIHFDKRIDAIAYIDKHYGLDSISDNDKAHIAWIEAKARWVHNPIPHQIEQTERVLCTKRIATGTIEILFRRWMGETFSYFTNNKGMRCCLSTLTSEGNMQNLKADATRQCRDLSSPYYQWESING